MKNKCIEFDLTHREDSQAFGAAVRALNENGVPFHTTNSGPVVCIHIEDGC